MTGTDDLYLLVALGGERVAFPAAEVRSVVEIDEIAPLPLVAPHVAGLFALRSRVLTVIDALVSLGLGATDLSRRSQTAVIVAVDGHSYAILVDDVEDVVAAPPAEPLPSTATGGWVRAALGMIMPGDSGVLLLDPAALVAGRGTAERAAA